jgi:hypothetical protein
VHPRVSYFVASAERPNPPCGAVFLSTPSTLPPRKALGSPRVDERGLAGGRKRVGGGGWEKQIGGLGAGVRSLGRALPASRPPVHRFRPAGGGAPAL